MWRGYECDYCGAGRSKSTEIRTCPVCKKVNRCDGCTKNPLPSCGRVTHVLERSYFSRSAAEGRMAKTTGPVTQKQQQ